MARQTLVLESAVELSQAADMNGNNEIDLSDAIIIIYNCLRVYDVVNE